MRYNEPVAGRTRLVKEMFLFDKQAKPPQFFGFEPDKFGPNSKQLLRLLDFLVKEGTVQKSDDFGGTYSLTPSGLEEANVALRKLTAAERAQMEAIKRRWNLSPMPSLLHYVYTTFPAYTVKSEIKDRVLREGS